MRLGALALAVAVTAMALTSRLSIYQLVNESGKVVLVAAFVIRWDLVRLPHLRRTTGAAA